MKVQKKLKSLDNPLPVILGIVFAVLLLVTFAFGASFLSVLVLIVGLLFFRLFSGKLRLSDEDIVLFWGLPGSGKTMFLSKCGRDLKKKGWHIAGNDQAQQSINCIDYNFDKRYQGFFEPIPHTCLIIDEASLNGFDNRTYSTNFTPQVLDFWKKHRQHECAILLSNQGFQELDIKIRQSLTTVNYYVENKGRYSRAIRMDKNVSFDPDTGEPLEGYKLPSLLSRLVDPASVLYVWHSAEGRHFKTNCPRKLPSIRDVANYDIITDKKGNTISVTPKITDISCDND